MGHEPTYTLPVTQSVVIGAGEEEKRGRGCTRIRTAERVAGRWWWLKGDPTRSGGGDFIDGDDSAFPRPLEIRARIRGVTV